MFFSWILFGNRTHSGPWVSSVYIHVYKNLWKVSVWNSCSNSHQVTILQSTLTGPRLECTSPEVTYTTVGVTFRLLIRLLACALGSDSGLPVTVSLCSHLTINCHLNSKGHSNKNSKINLEKIFKGRLKYTFEKS